jgi:hypothetical protein
MDLEKVRFEILNLWEKYPNIQGNRKIKFSGEYPEGYARYKNIGQEIDRIMGRPMFPYQNVQLNKLYEILKNDGRDFLYTKGIFEYNWNIGVTYSLYKKEGFEIDYNGDRILVDKIISGEERNFNTIRQKLLCHYNVDNSYLYLLGIKDNDNIFKYKKIGVSTCPNKRILLFNTSVPFDIYPLSIWKVSNDTKFKLESYFHKKFKNIHKKLEWYIDDENKIQNIMDNDKMLNNSNKVDLSYFQFSSPPF